MSLDVLRAAGPGALADLLLAAPDRCVIVPDAETVGDLQLIGDAWVQAQRRGRPVGLRCAASMASVVTGARPRPLRLAPAGKRPGAGRVRVVHLRGDRAAGRAGRAGRHRLA